MSLLEQAAAPDVLRAAWEHVERKSASGGVDGIGVPAFRRGLGRRLERLRRELLTRRYTPDPALAFEIPKPGRGGETRELALPTVRDKVAQQAVRSVIEPICDPRFRPASYGYRPGKGPAKAVRRVAHILRSGRVRFVSRRDVQKCFDSIPHAPLLDALNVLLLDSSVDWLVSSWIGSGSIHTETGWQRRSIGIPQGCVLSPLLANVYLHRIDLEMEARGVAYVRYADDLVAFAESRTEIEHVSQLVERTVSELRLDLKPVERSWTTVTTAFDFLGIRFSETRLLVAPAKVGELRAEIRRASSAIKPGRLPEAFDTLTATLDGYSRYYGALVEAAELAPLDEEVAQGLGRTWPLLEDAADRKIFRRRLEQLPWLAAAGRARRRDLKNLVFGASKHRPHRSRALRVQERRGAATAVRASELVVVTPGAFVGRRGNRFVVRRKGKTEASVPASAIRHIMLGTRGAGCSSAVVQWCAERGVPITFVDDRGNVFARIESVQRRSSQILRAQLAALESSIATTIAKETVRGKLRNQLNLLRYVGKYQQRSRSGYRILLGAMAREFAALEHRLRRLRAASLPELRSELLGLESRGALLYWEGFRKLLEGYAVFERRHRRGATDPVNCLLNYGYGILYGRVENACLRVGLDPTVGFLHVERRDAAALTFDLIEAFRAPIVDRAVLALLRRREPVNLDQEGRLTDKTRRRITKRVLARLGAYTRYRSQRLTLDQALLAQCELLVRAVSGQARYRAFICSW